MRNGEHPECLPEWVELLAASGRRLPADAILEVLSWAENHQAAADSLRAILGVRGGWLAAKHPRWRKYAGSGEAIDPSTAWETGASHERMAVLRDLRARDSGRARELVASTFAADAADRRTAFVGELARGLSMEDEPFLEATLDDRSKETRREAAELLRRLPESRLCLRMIERARVGLSWKDMTLVVDPPASCDKAMTRDGVEPKPAAYLKVGERAWWLHEIVSSVPTKAITAILGQPPAKIIEASYFGEWATVLWSALATSSIRQCDAEWAEPLLDGGPGKPSPLESTSHDQELLEILPPDRRDSFLLGRLRLRVGSDPLSPSHPAFGFLGSLKSPVGVPVAREILRHVRLVLEQERARFADPARRASLQKWSDREYDPKFHDHRTISLIQSLAAILPLEVADEAAEGIVEDESPGIAYAAAYATMIDRLRFRRDLYREFAP
jgi:Family of unknown function (DUF5691)